MKLLQKCLVIAVVLAMCLNAQTVDKVLDLNNGLVGFWSFDDPTNVGKDYSGFDNFGFENSNGNENGTGVIEKLGAADAKVGAGALRLNATDSTIFSVLCNEQISPELLPTHNMTFSMWMKTTDMESNWSFCRHEHHFTPMQSLPSMDWTPWSVVFAENDENFNYCFFDNSFMDGAWKNFVVTYEAGNLGNGNFVAEDSSIIRVYMSGNLLAEKTYGTNGMYLRRNSEFPINFGGAFKGYDSIPHPEYGYPRYGNVGELYTGDLDDIRLYNRCLNVNEILLLSNPDYQGLVPAPNTEKDIVNGLVAEYAFDNASDLGADGVGSNDGSVDGVTGEDGAAFFNGEASISIDPENLNMTDEMTVSVWLKTEDTSITSTQSVVRHDGHITALQLMSHDTTDYMTIWGVPFVDGNFSWDNPSSAIPTSFLLDSTWHHYAITYKNYTADDFGDIPLTYSRETAVLTKIYLDGKVLSYNDSTFAGALGTSDEPFVFGNSESGTEGFSGWLDNVKIYSRELNEVEVYELYDKGDGRTSQVVSIDDDNDIAKADEFKLSQNYPNPFNPTTVINFNIPTASFVELTVYNMLGQKVQALVNEYKSVNTYNVDFDASNLSSGVYFYQLKAGKDVNITKKMMLVK